MNVSIITLASGTGKLPLKVFQPAGAPRGGVIFFMDAFGWRSELDGMCARYAQHGYACYLPDLYWRLGTLRFPPHKSASDPLPAGMDAANLATTVEMSIADTGLILDFARTNGIVRVGTVGHCMGARHALGALACYRDTVRAAACLHGGRMVWDGPNSPHLYLPRVRGEVYFAFAADDPTCPDAHKLMIEEAARNANAHIETEHFKAAHGWTFPERWCYDRAAAERVWSKVIAMFDRSVAA